MQRQGLDANMRLLFEAGPWGWGTIRRQTEINLRRYHGETWPWEAVVARMRTNSNADGRKFDSGCEAVKKDSLPCTAKSQYNQWALTSTFGNSEPILRSWSNLWRCSPALHWQGTDLRTSRGLDTVATWLQQVSKYADLKTRRLTFHPHSSQCYGCFYSPHSLEKPFPS